MYLYGSSSRSPTDLDQRRDNILLRCHDPTLVEPTLKPILPSPIILTPIHWAIMRSAGPSKTNHQPRNAPWHAQATTLYVLTTHRLWTIEWAQTSTSSGYLGIQRMIQLLRKALWWPSLPTDFSSYINTCPICAQVHTPYQLLARLLEPFSMPQHPWWHILVDFVTDLPCSRVFTTILIAVNQFSKACKLVPLKSQFTAMETLAPLSGACISLLRYLQRHHVRQEKTVHLLSLEGLL